MDPDQSNAAQPDAVNSKTAKDNAKDTADDGEASSPAKPSETHETSWFGRLLGRGRGHAVASDGTGGVGQDLPTRIFDDFSPAERAMVANIRRLRDLTVEDVMTPRADVVAVGEDAALEAVIAASERGSHSRLPVYRETLDDPIGFVHVKDLALQYGFGRRGTNEFRITDFVRTALFVPPSMRIAALLQKMQADRVHMALVIDEFGGVDGLVTIEDLVEQIVGDIEDEHDREGIDEWAQERDGTWLVQARADIREFQAAEDLDLLPPEWAEDIDTVGGLVFMLANRVPTRGEVIVHPTGYEFEIVDADPRKIKRVRVRDGNGRATLTQAAE